MRSEFNKKGHGKDKILCHDPLRKPTLQAVSAILLAGILLLPSCTPKDQDGVDATADRITQKSVPVSSNETAETPIGASTGAGEIELPLDPF